MVKSKNPGGYVLGLDVGANSIGWAALSLSTDMQPDGIIACGSRVFDAGVDGDIATGRDTPRGTARRLARLQRRQTLRRVRRRRKLFRALVQHGLLPATDAVNSASMHKAIEALDAELRTKWIPAGDHRSHLVFPYLLRAAAARERLAPHELGRALYHLGHRRGFLSNRKTKRKEEEEGAVKEGIHELREQMKSAGCATLGALFATLDPREHRIRKRYTDRSMYLEEFGAIRKANAWVPDAVWTELHKAIFFQRKLKSAKHLIGRCSCMPNKRRAPMWHPTLQQFRILEQLNNLRIIEGPASTARPLSPEQRNVLAALLQQQETMTAGGAKKALKLKGVELSIESVGSGKLIGDRTACAMRKAFGDRWDAMTDDQRMQALLDVHSYEQADALKRRGVKHWALSPEQAGVLGDTSLEPSYASLSVAAMQRLLPHMQEGLNSREAMDRVFPDRFKASEQADHLRRVDHVLGEIRNPAVMRSLTELRRVVNRAVTKWGRPALIRLELARDLKKGRQERERLAKDNRDQEKRRTAAVEQLLAETAVKQPRRSDIEKLLLADECGFTCPYTGRKFGMADLFGATPSVDIEHIIPYSRSLDDSFGNKTLCMVEENRNIKRQRTPHEAYATDAVRWEAILDRVQRFRGRHARFKFERFTMQHVGEELLEEFTERQLNDTRYASRLAAKFVGQLFGGVVDAEGSLRVQVSGGSVTARLRQSWRMGVALHDDGTKNRNDHRHHALDAIAIALASPAVVKRMSDAAVRGAAAGRDGKLLQFTEPWPQFLEHVKAAIDPIIVSHRVDRRLAGPLHEETLYSRPLMQGEAQVFRVRKGIETVRETALDEIADPTVRTVVATALKGEPAAKPFATPDRFPVARSAGGAAERVRRLRLEAARTPVEMKTPTASRWVAPGSNHHMAIYAVQTKKGVEWQAQIVTRLEAHRRKQMGEPIVRKQLDDGSPLVFTLRSGDIIRIPEADGSVAFHLVGAASKNSIETKLVHDARPAGEIRKAGIEGGRTYWSTSKLQRVSAQKIDIGVLGEVTLNRE